MMRNRLLNETGSTLSVTGNQAPCKTGAKNGLAPSLLR